MFIREGAYIRINTVNTKCFPLPYLLPEKGPIQNISSEISNAGIFYLFIIPFQIILVQFDC